MAKKLPELSERVSSVDSDIFLVNSSNLDYKQTKETFLASERARMDEIEDDVATNGENITDLQSRVQDLEFENFPTRTATADTDLIHVNSGGTDYKETKINFLKGDFQHTFSNTSSLTSQVDAINVGGAIFGTIAGYGNQTAAGLPINANCYVKAQKYVDSYCVAEIWAINYAQENHWVITKNNNTWGSWEKVPARSEINTLNNSLINSSAGVRFACRAMYGASDSATIFNGMDLVNGKSRQLILCMYSDQAGGRRMLTIFTGQSGTLPATGSNLYDNQVTYALSQSNNDIIVSGCGNWGYGYAIGLVAV